MKIGVIPPVPMEPFVASPHEVTNLWSAFFLERDRTEILETARVAGFPDNYSVWARSLYGLACERGLDAIYFPNPGAAKEVRRVLSALEQQDTRVEPFDFPLLRNETRLREELENLCAALGVEGGILRSVMERWQQVRTVLRRFDGLQQRTGAFSSWDYVTMLARCMDPQGDFDGLRRVVERGILEYKDLGRDRWRRIGVLGLPPCRKALYDAMEKKRTVVVYDEWGVENNPMAPPGDLVETYFSCSLAYGLKRRRERILKEAKTRRIQGFILGVEYLCDSLRDEGFFRSSLGFPVFTIENRERQGLSEAEARGLDRFLEQVERAP